MAAPQRFIPRLSRSDEYAGGGRVRRGPSLPPGAATRFDHVRFNSYKVAHNRYGCAFASHMRPEGNAKAEDQQGAQQQV